MTAHTLDGKALAASLRQDIAIRAARFTAETGTVARLAVILVGEDAASQVYVRSKLRATQEVGLGSLEYTLPVETPQTRLLALIEELNQRRDVHGILVQLPVPPHIESKAVIEAIDPAKDVDGFHPVNAGRLATGLPALVPCTPAGCLRLIHTVHPSLRGLEAVVVGRSNIVGKPVAQLLLAQDATVTIAHSRTMDIETVCRRADILVAAVGRPEMIRGSWIKPGATVIDVGINRMATPEGKSRLVGDVAYAEACEVAGAITPVPGGVGPMTIACLLDNTLEAALAQTKKGYLSSP